MAKKDDALTLQAGRSPKGPTAQDLTRAIQQKQWLDQNLKWGSLRRIAYSQIRDVVTSGEIVQEVYNDMLQWTLEELRGLRKPQAYASASVRNRVYRCMEIRSRAVPLQDDYAESLECGVSMEQALEDAEQVQLLLSNLQIEWLEPWLLKKYYGWKYEEIAARQGLTVDAVKGRVRRADDYLNTLATLNSESSIIDRIRKLFKRKERRHAE